MENIQITIGDMIVTVPVRDAAEAGAFVASLDANKNATKLAPTGAAPATSVKVEPKASPPVTDAILRGAIERLRGTASAKVVSCLAKKPGGLSLDEIRAAIALPDVKLGPVFANISKACVRSEISTSDLYTKSQSRSGGIIVQHYRLTPQAIHIIGTMPQFPE